MNKKKTYPYNNKYSKIEMIDRSIKGKKKINSLKSTNILDAAISLM